MLSVDCDFCGAAIHDEVSIAMAGKAPVFCNEQCADAWDDEQQRRANSDGNSLSMMAGE